MGRIELLPGFAFFLAWLAWLGGAELFWWYLVAAALHEAAHAAAIYLFGGRILKARLGFGDAYLRTSLLPPRAAFWCALTGPAVNLLCALTLGRAVPAFAAISLLLGAYNLLPVWPLDGGRMVNSLLTALFPAARAERLCCVSGAVACAGLLGVGVWLYAVRGAGIWPLFAAGCLTVRVISLRVGARYSVRSMG